jgi:hypothetical protein
MQAVSQQKRAAQNQAGKNGFEHEASLDAPYCGFGGNWDFRQLLWIVGVPDGI